MSLVFNSPLEQFEFIHWQFNSTSFFLKFFFGNIHTSIILLCCFTAMVAYFMFLNYNKNGNLNLFFGFFNFIHFFIIKLFYDNFNNNNINIKITKNITFFIFLFFWVIVVNLCGLIPFSFTATSYISITLFLSFIFFFSSNILGLKEKKHIYFNLFLPNNVPSLLIFLLIPIEIISYIARLLSLGIRLFANMLAGHTLLKILIGFLIQSCIVLSLYFSLTFLNIIFSLVILSIIILECLIACLQAYVFVLLTIIYYNEAVNINEH